MARTKATWAAWLVAPLDGLRRVFDAQDGNGPLGDLTASAAAVLGAVHSNDYLPAQLRSLFPAGLAAAHERLNAALALAAEAIA
jgi:hypothetical protein